MSVKAPVPCRLWVLMARKAQSALILCRGPTRWVELILWDTKKDQFQRGQWFHGRIYEERSDLSPDGTKFIYFVSKNGLKHDAGIGETWTAISKPPYFTALALWPNGSTYGGGGLFLDDRYYWRADWPSGIHPRFSVKGLIDVTDAVISVSFHEKFLDDRIHLQFRHVGWSTVELQGCRPVRLEKPSPIGKGALRLERVGSLSHYSLVLTDYRAEPKPFDAEWADWDQRGRLIIARAGKLLVGIYTRRKGLQFEELADFNANRPRSVEAPEWAKHW
jgi:hypothetical protein